MAPAADAVAVKRSGVIRDTADLHDRTGHCYENESPERHPRYPLIYLGELEPPPEEAEPERRLATRPADALFRVILVRDLGRDRIGPADLAAKSDELVAECTDLALTARTRPARGRSAMPSGTGWTTSAVTAWMSTAGPCLSQLPPDRLERTSRLGSGLVR